MSDVLIFIADPARQTLFIRAMGASFTSVAIGYVVGIVCGVAIAMLGQVLPVAWP